MFRLANVAWACLFLVTAAQTTAAAEPEFKLRASLTDGSLIIGTTTNTSLKVDVGFDELTIPLERVRQVTQQAKSKTVQIELNNGDIYSGKLAADTLNMQTIFGPVKLTTDQVIGLEVMPVTAMSWLPTERGLVVYYPLDDGAEATNHAGDKLHGVCTKVKWLQQGRRDGALDFDGSAQITVAHHADLCPQKFTQAAWIYPRGETSAYQVVWGKTNPGSWSPGYGLVRLSGDTKHLHFFVNYYSGSTVKAAIPIDKWSHVAATFDGSTLVFYLNGVKVDSKDLRQNSGIPANQPLIKHTETPLLIGADGGHHYGWKGKLDDFVMFNRPLDARDIRRLYELAPRELPQPRRGTNPEKPAEEPRPVDPPAPDPFGESIPEAVEE